MKNSGNPMAIALSADAQRLMVSQLDVKDGSVKTTISFMISVIKGKMKLTISLQPIVFRIRFFLRLPMSMEVRQLHLGIVRSLSLTIMQKHPLRRRFLYKVRLKAFFMMINIVVLFARRQMMKVST